MNKGYRWEWCPASLCLQGPREGIMPPTLVNVAVGVLLGVALLGAAFDRRSLGIVAGVAAFPDVDVVLGVMIPGATNAWFHSVVIPLAAAVVVLYDTKYRDVSWLYDRFGWYGVRVTWVAIAVYAVAGIGPDLFNIESVAVFYPLSDRYYAVVGRLVFSTQEGFIQTYVSVSDGWLAVASPGTTETHQVSTWLTPEGEGDGSGWRIGLVDAGWQLVLVATEAAAAAAKPIHPEATD